MNIERKKLSPSTIFWPNPNAPERLFDILDGKIVFLLMKNLSDPYKKVMQMRYSQDLSIKEISLITGQSKNSVTVQLHRGLKKLKALYEH